MTEDDLRACPEWIWPVAAQLKKLDVPKDLSVWCLALLDLTEMDSGPTPQVDIDPTSPDWLSLTWQAGDRTLWFSLYADGRMYWSRKGTQIWDSARPLRRDHPAVLRDLLLWLTQGIEIHVPNRKGWWLHDDT